MDIEKGKGLHFDIHYLYPFMDEGIDRMRLLVEPTGISLSSEQSLSSESAILPMTEQEFERSPSFADELPVERQYEYEFTQYLGRPAYDRRPKIPPLDRMDEYEPPTTAYDHSEDDRREHISRIREIAAQDLHSAAAIIGYEVQTAGQTLGKVVDIVFDAGAWKVLALVVAGEGVSGEERLLDLALIKSFDWSASVAFVHSEITELPQLESANKSAQRS